MKEVVIILLFSCVMMLPMPARAQRVSRSYQDCPMTDVLTDLSHAAKKQRIAFIYNDLEDYTVTQHFDSLTIADAIRACIGYYPISLTSRGDSILLVECTQKQPFKFIGRIINDKGLPVTNANITLFSTTDTTVAARGVSNANGQFVIPTEQQEVIAHISHIAYQPVNRRFHVSNVGDIRLSLAVVTLGSVNVTANIPKHVDKQYYKYAAETERRVWAMDLPQFHTTSVPQRYLYADAIVLADYDSIGYDVQHSSYVLFPTLAPMRSEQWIHTTHIHRTRYFINRQKAGIQLSRIPFSKKTDMTDLMFHKLTVMGIRVIKPDGSIRLVNTYPYFKPQMTALHAGEAVSDTILIGQLEQGDILDMFVFHNFQEPLSPYRFQVPQPYPVLNCELRASTGRHIVLQQHESNLTDAGSVTFSKKGSSFAYSLNDYVTTQEEPAQAATIGAQFAKRKSNKH
jgi:hypothetical protein